MKTIYQNSKFLTINCGNTTCDNCSCLVNREGGRLNHCLVFGEKTTEERLASCKEAECDFRNFKTIFYYTVPLQVVVDEKSCGNGNRPEGTCQFLLWDSEDYPKCKLFGSLKCVFRPQRHVACIEKAL